MKEMTYEDWIKNPTPRMMWVWNDEENRKIKEKVVYISEIDEHGKVLSVYQKDDQTFSMWYEHCAEIEEPKKRPCTKEELVEMLKKQGIPMLKHLSNVVRTVISIHRENVFDEVGDISYLELCNQYTLLDGTELWVEE